MKAQIKQAIEILKNGGIVIFPTDTVFGIGCRIDNENALKKLFKIRNRPEEKAVLAVVDSIKMAKKYVQINKNVQQKLINKYWPGGLTIVFPCYIDKIPSLARGGGSTLAVRETDHPVLLELIKGVRVPIVAPSANFSGQPTPKNFNEIDKKILALVDFAINSPTGGNSPSTIIDCSTRPWKILRQGALRINF